MIGRRPELELAVIIDEVVKANFKVFMQYYRIEEVVNSDPKRYYYKPEMIDVSN